ncbi:MAG: PAS domain S-box protein, partial [Deltaproteobacteria bacterium]|nr:PAS domain S-box protein [Deltaproteobacteria bacterium]
DAIISEIQFTRDNGGKTLFMAKAKPIYDHEGAVVGAIETIRDITERKKTEEALRNSESKYRSIFENVSDFLIVHDMEGKLIETNLASKMEIGYTADDVAGMNIIDLMPDQYKPLFKEYMDDLIKHGKQEGLISILTKEGSERVIEYKNLLIADSYGEPVCVQGSGRDITERIKAEKALKISEERYRNILDSIEEAYFEVDLEGRFTFFNSALGENLGYTDKELKGMNYKQYLDDANAKKVFDMFHNVYLTGLPTKAFDWEMKNKNGEKMYVEASVALMKNSKDIPVGFRGIVRDITERKEAENERDRYEMRLSQAQKMEAIGTLAGGIAHDFNNMLSAIIGYTELVKIDLPEESRARMNLDQVLKAGMRARELVAQILSFSRKFKAERESVKVGLIINEALKLLRVTIPTSIEIRENIGCESGTVFADPTEIHQIIMNLCTNAYQAMEKHGGILSVGLESIEIVEEDSTLNLPKGLYLKLVVCDTGCGMSEETTKNIFDPFFTTKERGKGTGLGLATAHRIVSELKGSISVKSIEGRGTTFSIYLPMID